MNSNSRPSFRLRLRAAAGLLPFAGALALCVLVFAACSSGDETTSGAGASSRAAQQGASLPSNLFSADPLPDVRPSMLEVKNSAAAGDEVTFAAVIGGRRDPFVKGRAVAVITDVDLSTCYYGHCDAPWDACCVAKEAIVEQSGTLQIVDTDGNPIAVDLRDASPLVAGAEIEVSGVVEQAPDGVFVVSARRIHVISLDPVRWQPKEG